MKQRITYLLREPDELRTEHLEVTGKSLIINNLKAAKEHRLTLSLSELPNEVSEVLRQCHELHIRWASQDPYTSIPPFVSRVSPGLHAFFTPRNNSKADSLCPWLKKIFHPEFKCESPRETFISLPILSERFSMSSALQYHQLLPTLSRLVSYIKSEFCSRHDSTCQEHASRLLSASYIDMDYNAISHALVINALWNEAPDGSSWHDRIERTRDDETIEVGILSNETPEEPEELKLGGFLVVVGDDDTPKATRFSFPSRHYPLPLSISTTYRTTFKRPTGLHPVMQLTLPRASLQPPSKARCSLHTYLTLPSALFIDKYAFSDALTLRSLNLAALRTVYGETDLEAPDWVIPKFGSAALFELATPSLASQSTSLSTTRGTAVKDTDIWTVEIPLHLRYLPPTSGGYTPLAVPWPVVFWACTADEGTRMVVNPFDRVNLGYDGLFGDRTMFYHVPPSPGNGTWTGREAEGRLVETLQVPVLDLRQAWYVEWGTVVAVVVGTAWVCWKLWRGGRMGEGPRLREGRGGRGSSAHKSLALHGF
ncbi:hypothetical protein W97_05758 [Coniosporium apollinis CBS 100218]|uniref:Protein PBN1 n=1 Tax=Coniosporium apollinis (strain CBS 100218) TaxID=1168221 RepID=R7YXD6_CONA1|nr:uncharacterized protein W97_05758 [Coniosporium apollinis CBS 100218]EON66513.1 hypothetical protein W97_05758 [Coniosporium apollinis CBS 100218]